MTKQFYAGGNVPDEKTLADRWLERLKNNPVVAVVVIAGIALSGGSAVFKALPDSVQSEIIAWFHPAGKPTNGWGYVGNLSKSDRMTWASSPKIEMIRQSPAPDREYPFRTGDMVRVVASIPQVTVDYRDKKDFNVLVAPPHLRNIINPDSDYTGLKFAVGDEYEIADVSVAAYPNHDAVMWVRLVPR